MSRYYCDLHIHSCLSPCGDDDMTPANIAAMCMLNKLNVVALTDHNSAKNCPAFFAQAKKFNIVPIAGMELTTAEDIHAVCLFRTLEAALDFDSYISCLRPKIINKPSVFGNQSIYNENDEIVSEEEILLINATDISLEKAYEQTLLRGGICFPAHIDRVSNGIVSVLGAFPDFPAFTAYELYDEKKQDEYLNKFPLLKNLKYTVSSDAHNLADIREADFCFEMQSDLSDDAIRNTVIDILSGTKV